MSLLHLIIIINTFFGLLAQEIKKKNHVLSPEDRDIDSINVEEILKKLKMERAKNKNLNQTISDILEEMEDMKKNIMRNEEKITDNQLSVFLLTRDVEELGTMGTWCAYRYLWDTVGTITYSDITFSDSINMMEITDTPLDINTGN